MSARLPDWIRGIGLDVAPRGSDHVGLVHLRFGHQLTSGAVCNGQLRVLGIGLGEHSKRPLTCLQCIALGWEWCQP